MRASLESRNAYLEDMILGVVGVSGRGHLSGTRSVLIVLRDTAALRLRIKASLCWRGMIEENRLHHDVLCRRDGFIGTVKNR